MEDTKNNRSVPSNIAQIEKVREVKTLDAYSLFKDEGLTFINTNPDGTAHVQAEDGSEYDFDPKEYARQNNVIPSKDFEATYNSPDSALNESPVGLMDRLKLSFGNSKGQAAYLKTKFKDAKLNNQNEMVVKDKGVWKRVDLDGLGDDSGWKASEIIADVFDVGGDAVVQAGAALGTTAATVSSVLSGGIAAPAAGAMIAGGGLAGAGIKQALGRVLGTYDATPGEVVKDLLWDTALATVGEVIPIGVASKVSPAFKSGLSKMGSRLEENTQKAFAKAFASVDDENSEGAFRYMFARPQQALDIHKRVIEAGKQTATIKGGNLLPGSAPVTESQAAMDAVMGEVNNIGGGIIKNLQKDLTNFYQKHSDEILKETAKDIPSIDLNLKNEINNLDANFEGFLQHTELGKARQTVIEESLEPKRTIRTVTKESSGEANALSNSTDTIKKVEGQQGELVTTKKGVADRKAANKSQSKTTTETVTTGGPTKKIVLTDAPITGKALQNVLKDKWDVPVLDAAANKMAKELNVARSTLQTLKRTGIKSTDDIKNLMAMSKQLDDVFHDALPRQARDQLKNAGLDLVTDLQDTIARVLGKKHQSKFKALSGKYRVHKAHTNKIQGGLAGTSKTNDTWDSRARALFDSVKKSSYSNPEAAEHRDLLNTIHEIVPGGVERINALRDRQSAAILIGRTASGAQTASAGTARLLGAAVKNVVVPQYTKLNAMANKNSTRQLISSPQFGIAYKALNTLKEASKKGSINENLVGNGLGIFLQNLYEKK